MILQALIQIDNNLAEIAIRFLVNVLVITILVRGIYFYFKKDKEYAFTFFLFNVLVFFMCYLMLAIEISMGFAFGLFAIFGILRYRTDTIPIKEMTYLFTSIAIALINSVGEFSWVSVFMNIMILMFVFMMEKIWFTNREQSTSIRYEKIELLQGDKERVLEDLRNRTHLKVTHFEVRTYNFLNDSAMLKIYFTPDE